MPSLISIPEFDCFIHERYLYNMDTNKLGILKATVIGVSSYIGHTLTFHVLIRDTGSIFSYIPIDALLHNHIVTGMQYDYSVLCYHICVDDNVVYQCLEYLKDKCSWTYLKVNGTLKCIRSSYIGTFDWPDDNILQHLVKLNNGQLALVPNHKIIINEVQLSLPDYKKLRKSWV